MPRQEATPQLVLKSEQTTANAPRAKATRASTVSPRAGEHYGRYQLQYLVAEGGMAAVWLAQVRGEYGFARDVAIKMILPSFAREPNFRDMFLDEACIASRVQHPNVAQILELGEHDGKLYMVMEWVDGDSLANLLHAAEAQQRQVPLPVVLRILADACAGLHAAHELRDSRGHKLEVVHRDVSPQNILLGEGGCVKVIDFGVLKARGRLVDETLDGIVKGKLHYVAPERALGVNADCRADVWAVGAILYRILGGRPVYDGQGNLAVVRQLIGQGEVRPLPRSVPRVLRDIVYTALARDPAQRYASMADLQRELEAVLHRFPSATTSQDVASFVESVLGPSLNERRVAIKRARERHDGSVRQLVSQPHIMLVPSLSARETKPDADPPTARFGQGGTAKPALKLVSALPLEELKAPSLVSASTAPRARVATRPPSPPRARELAAWGLVPVAGLLSALLGWHLYVDFVAPRAAEAPVSVSAPAVPSHPAAPPAHLPAPPSRPHLVFTPPTRAAVVNLADLPLETGHESAAASAQLQKTKRVTHPASRAHAGHGVHR